MTLDTRPSTVLAIPRDGKHRLTSETYAACQALHDAAIYFEDTLGGRFISGHKVAEILADRVAATDAEYLRAMVATAPAIPQDPLPGLGDASSPYARHAHTQRND